MPKHKSGQINLLPREESERQTGARLLKWLLGTFRFLVVTVELVVIVGFLARFFLDSRNADLSDEIEQKKILAESYLPFEKEFRFEQARIQTAKDFSQDSTLKPYLEVISENIPSEVILQSVSNDKDGVQIIVTSRSEFAIQSFATILEKNPSDLFDGVKIDSIDTESNSDTLRVIMSVENTIL